MNIQNIVQSYENDMIEAIAQLIKIKSVQEAPLEGKPFGQGPYEALKKTLEIADSLGFKTVNLDNYCGYAEVGSGEDIIGILCHVDIVPEGDGWDFDPYGAEVKDGKIYGRGTNDDKGPAVMSLYAVKTLMDLGVEFNKRVRIIIGANEESGFQCVEHYKKVEGELTCGFSPDGAFPVIYGEKGIVQIGISGSITGDDEVRLVSVKGGEAPNVVCPKITFTLKGENMKEVEEKFTAYGISNDLKTEILESSKDEATFRLSGVSAHAMAPEEGKNSASYMFDFLKTIMKNNSLVNNYNELIGLDYNGNNCGAACKDEYGVLTLNVGLVDIKEDKFDITIDIRYPITKDFSEIYKNITSSFEKTGYNLNLALDKKPLYVDPESDLVKILQNTYTEVSGDTKSKPYTIGGGTYSRAFNNVVPYGVLFPEDEENAHQKNESLRIETVLKGTHILSLAVKRLLEI